MDTTDDAVCTDDIKRKAINCRQNDGQVSPVNMCAYKYVCARTCVNVRTAYVVRLRVSGYT